MEQFRFLFSTQPASADGTPLTPVFRNGEAGCACYRIPAIICAGDGSLVAFAEARRDNCADSGGVIRIVARRSVDQGRSWKPIQVIGQNLLPDGRESMTASPAPVVDRMDPANPQGVIFCVFNKTENSEFDVAAGKGARRVYITRSLDHGQTWGEAAEITAQVMRPGWRQQIPTVGHAIQLRSGRLFFSAHITIGSNSVYNSQNYLFWSDDHGHTWTIGGLNPQIGHNETTAVELADGSVMVNARAYIHGKPAGRRAVIVYPFDHQGNIVITPGRLDTQLVTPTVASSLLRCAGSGGDRGILLFSGPHHPHLRVNLTVRPSFNEGQTWLPGKVIDPGPSAYSDLVEQSDGRIGVLYERGNNGGIFYTSFSRAWLQQVTPPSFP